MENLTDEEIRAYYNNGSISLIRKALKELKCGDGGYQTKSKLIEHYIIKRKESPLRIVEDTSQKRLDEILERHAKQIEFLTKNGENLDLQCSLEDIALVYASEVGLTSIVEILLHRGANPNLVTKWNLTALSVAALEGHIDIVELLLENGATDYERARKNSIGYPKMTELIEQYASGYYFLEAETHWNENCIKLRI